MVKTVLHRIDDLENDLPPARPPWYVLHRIDDLEKIRRNNRIKRFVLHRIDDLEIEGFRHFWCPDRSSSHR